MINRALRFALLPSLLLTVAGLALAAPPAETDFSAIDQHALNAPTSVTHSVEALAAYLIQPARNDLEKTRAIFRWITANINYDTNAFFGGESTPPDALDVLASHKSICRGYSNLFQKLATAAGLQVVTIRGFARGFGYEIGHDNGRSNHSWNAVWLDGRWQLLDSTWGAGYVNNNRQFVRQFTGYYFLTSPRDFIFNHFPLDPKWQLLDQPLTREQFDRQVMVWPKYFQYGIRVVSHKDATIMTNGPVTITFTAPPPVCLRAKLRPQGRDLPESDVARRQQGNRWTFVVNPPSAGEYQFELYANPKQEYGMFDSVLKYRIIDEAGGAG